MIPGLSNAGSMPISLSGGHASASNGDSVFDAGSTGNGLNYSPGVPVWALLAFAALALIAWVKK